MVVGEGKCFIPIGCSCINKFQIDFYFKKKAPSFVTRGSLLDWMIVSPRSSVEYLNCVADVRANCIFENKENYAIDGGYMHNKHFKGFYFWHEDALNILEGSGFLNFSEKVTHLLSNSLDVAGQQIFLIWSNIQPNLLSDIGKTSMVWEDFFLSQEVYESLKASAVRAYGNDARLVCVCRSEDIDTSLIGKSDIFILDLPRGNDYIGNEFLYAPIFDQLLACS